MKTEKILFGVAYYDEYMPYDRIDKDMKMMKEAGINVIRIAESTWSTWEPQEGVFNFTHLHRMLDTSNKYGISVIIGTPTYAIPSWLAKKDDSILTTTHNGKNLYGPRQNMDITNKTYLKYAKRIIIKLLDEVKDAPNVIGYQIDNETKAYDTCSSSAQKLFINYLKEKYLNINEFNQEFGLNYWSNRIENWEDFPDIRGTINGSLDAEYKKFQRNLVTKFLAWQADIINKYKKENQFLTQNFDFGWHDYSFGLQPEVDHFQSSKCIDVTGCDIYHPAQSKLTGCEITACGNIARGTKRSNYLVLETEAQGNPQWLPYPNQLKLMAFSHIANGSNSVMYWHWHSIHNAIESYWKGVLSHDFSKNVTYKEISSIGNKFAQIGDKLKNLKKKNKIAIVADNASLTGLSEFPTETLKERSYNTFFRWVCDALYKLNFEYDVINTEPSLLYDYNLVIIPTLYCATEKYLNAINEYVKCGGNVIVTFKSGFSNEHLKIYHDTQPHIISEALGVKYDQFTYSDNVTIEYNSKVSETKEWLELVRCTTAKTLAYYNHKYWNEYSAISRNDYGTGHSLYLATYFSSEMLIDVISDFIDYIDFKDDISKLPTQCQYPIVVKQGINDYGKNIVYYLNYNDSTMQVKNIAGNGINLITTNSIKQNETFTLEPWGFAVVEY